MTTRAEETREDYSRPKETKDTGPLKVTHDYEPDSLIFRKDIVG